MGNSSQQLWYLVIKNFKSMIREIPQLIWLIGYPFLFILLFKFVFGNEAFRILAPSILILAPTVIISQLASHFAEEKESGTLQRLITTPVSRDTILLSGLFSQLIIGVIQTLILIILVALFGGKVPTDASILLVFFIPFLLTFSSLGFGLLLASFVKTSGSAAGLSWFIILPLQFLGGGFSQDVPLKFIPPGLAVEALRSIMNDAIITFETVWIKIIYLFIWGIVLVLIGILLFRRKTAIL
jgi:ABC-2 type transport system permease protein